MEKYIFRKQLNNRGCYAEIVYGWNFSEGLECKTVIIYLAVPEWELSCRMGILIFSDYLFRQRSGKFEITIYDVKWLPIDTNYLVMMFTTIKALANSLNINLSNLELNTANETFVFPEPRSIK